MFQIPEKFAANEMDGIVKMKRKNATVSFFISTPNF